MTNKTFVQSLAEKLEMDEAKAAILADQFVDVFVKEVMSGSLVSVQGFGNFEIKEKAERKMYNPTTKSFKVIPGKSVLGYKMSATLKTRINNK